MNGLEPRTLACPYCGERITVMVDCSIEEQHYIEDCQVCCRPIEIVVHVEPGGGIDLQAYSEDE